MTDTGFPQSNISIVDPKSGLATRAFWRLLENIWRRAGGWEDSLSDFQAADADFGALIQSLAAEQSETNEALRQIDATTRNARCEDACIRVDDIEGEQEHFRGYPFPQDEIDEINDAVQSLYVRLASIDPDAGGGGGAVESVFGRTGAITAQASDYDAAQIDYDNTSSGLSATNLQDAVDEIVGASGGLVSSVFGRTGAVVAAASDYDAAQVDFDNTSSSLTSTDVQGALEELASAGGGGGGAWSRTDGASVTNGAEADVALPDADKILIEYIITPLTDAVDAFIRLSTDGGSSFESGASDYGWGHRGNDIDGDVSAQNASTDSYISLWGASVGSDTNEYIEGTLIITGANTTSKFTNVRYDGLIYTAGGDIRRLYGLGVYLSTTVTDALRFAMSSGNIDAEVNVYEWVTS